MTAPREQRPYHIQLGHSASGSLVTKPYNLLPTDEGGVQWQRGLAPDIAPQQRTTAFSYEHRMPQINLDAAFESFRLGAGFEDAPDTGSLGFAGYNYTQGVDASWGKRVYLGPLKNAGSTTANKPKKMLMTSLGLFLVSNDASLYRWSGGGSWSDVLQVTSRQVTEIIEYSGSQGSLLLAAVSGGTYYYSFDRITWIPAETTPTTPAFRSTANTTTASATSLTPTEPASAAQNDILIAAVYADGEHVTPNDATFWAPIAFESVGGNASDNAQVYWGRRGGSAPDYQFNFASAVEAVVVVNAYSGCKTFGSPFDQIDHTSANSTTHTYDSITTRYPNTRVVYVAVFEDNVTSTEPSGTTERADVQSSNLAIAIADEEQAAVGSIGSNATTTGASEASALFVFNLIGAWVGPVDVARFVIRGASSGNPVLWAIDSKGDVRNTVVPTDVSAWSAADATQLGQKDVTVQGFEVIDNVFYLVHDRGITSYDGTTVSTVWEAKTLTLSSDNARPAIGPDNKLYFAFGGSLFRFDTTDNAITKIWPRGPQIGNAVVNGTITALTFDDGNGYFAIKNGAGDYYVMKFDPFFTVDVDSTTIWPAHTLYYNSTSAIEALYVAPADSSAPSSTNPTLVFGDGTTAGYLILPKPGVLPEHDSAYRFDTTTDRPIYGSFINYRAQSFLKWLTRGDIEGDDLDADDTITLQYQTPGGTATTIATANTDGRTTAVVSSEVEFTNVRYVALLNNGANTTSPILQGLVLHASPNPPRDEVFQFGVDLPDEVTVLDGSRDARFKGAVLETHLFNAKNERCTLTDPRGTSHTVKVLDIQPVYAKFKAGKFEAGYSVTAVSLT